MHIFREATEKQKNGMGCWVVVLSVAVVVVVVVAALARNWAPSLSFKLLIEILLKYFRIH